MRTSIKLRVISVIPALFALFGVALFVVSVLFVALYATPSMFPMVSASSEPPSFFLLHGFSIALLAAAALTVAGTWLTHRALTSA